MIDKLLDRYYAGMTSREEEKHLAELLIQNTEPRYDADRRIICALNRTMPDFGVMAVRASQRRLLMPLRWFAAAASVAIVLIAGSSLFKSEPVDVVAHEMTVEEATEQTYMALTMMSNAFDRGYDKINKLNDL